MFKTVKFDIILFYFDAKDEDKQKKMRSPYYFTV